MMVELAPQSKSGSYTRPKYSFNSRIGDANFPDEGGRYHLYVGNPCPVSGSFLYFAANIHNQPFSFLDSGAIEPYYQ